MPELDEEQKRMAEFILDKKQVYVAQRMGFGKTAVAIEVIRRTGQKAFVFAPIKVAWHVWPAELQKWAPELSFAIAHGPHKLGALQSDADVIIMNYDGIIWLAKQTIPWEKRLCILDEVSKMKSHSTERFERLSRARNLWTEYMLALSGTPAASGLIGLWSQYYLLDGGSRLGINITSFREQYCDAISRPGLPVTIYKVRKDKEAEIHGRIADITCSVDSSNKDTRPPVKHNKIMLDLPAPARKIYRELEKEFITHLKSGTVVVKNVMALSAKLRQVVQGALYIAGPGAIPGKADKNRKTEFIHSVKAEALRELVDLLQGEPLLCAVQFIFDPRIINKVFGKTLPKITGGTSEQETASLLARWDAGDLELLLTHPASTSHGLNMQKGGSNIVFYGHPWSLELFEQFEGRIRRRGQKAEFVQMHHLIMKDTMDEAIIDALNNNAKTQDDLIAFLQKRYCS